MPTDQEIFWSGEFGNEYSQRNTGNGLLAANIALFSKVLARTKNVCSVIEFGCNIGLNLKALRQIRLDMKLTGVEINKEACRLARGISGPIEVCEGSILDQRMYGTYNMSISKGLLIHIAPGHLAQAYDVLYQSSNRYILICEYFNPTPVEVDYRGIKDKMFKRDFAGDMLDQYRDLGLVDYGFCYRRDVNFPQDDMSWFLLEKNPTGL